MTYMHDVRAWKANLKSGVGSEGGLRSSTAAGLDASAAAMTQREGSRQAVCSICRLLPWLHLCDSLRPCPLLYRARNVLLAWSFHQEHVAVLFPPCLVVSGRIACCCVRRHRRGRALQALPCKSCPEQCGASVSEICGLTLRGWAAENPVPSPFLVPFPEYPGNQLFATDGDEEDSVAHARILELIDDLLAVAPRRETGLRRKRLRGERKVGARC